MFGSRPAAKAPTPPARSPRADVATSPERSAAARTAPAGTTAAAVLPHPDELVGSDNRSAKRRLASELPSISGVRLKPHGADATLINLSDTGVLVECASRLKPGTAVTVVFEGGFTPSSIDGRVARSTVATMQGGTLHYHIGIAFSEPLTLGDEPAAAHAEVSAPDETLVSTAHTAHTPVTNSLVLENRW